MKQFEIEVEVEHTSPRSEPKRLQPITLDYCRDLTPAQLRGLDTMTRGEHPCVRAALRDRKTGRPLPAAAQPTPAELAAAIELGLGDDAGFVASLAENRPSAPSRPARSPQQALDVAKMIRDEHFANISDAQLAKALNREEESE